MDAARAYDRQAVQMHGRLNESHLLPANPPGCVLLMQAYFREGLSQCTVCTFTVRGFCDSSQSMSRRSAGSLLSVCALCYTRCALPLCN